MWNQAIWKVTQKNYQGKSTILEILSNIIFEYDQIPCHQSLNGKWETDN